MNFPVSGIEVFPLWPFLAAMCVSFFSSMGGVSGAFLLLPFQVSVLGFVSPAVSPTTLVFNILAIPSGVYRFIREGRLLWPLAGAMVTGIVPGVFLGVYVRFRWMPEPRVFKLFVGTVLLYVAGGLVYDFGRRFLTSTLGNSERVPTQEASGNRAMQTVRFGWAKIHYRFRGETFAFRPGLVFLLAAVVGAISGAYGIGGGSIMSPILVAAFRLPVHSIAGAALTSTFATSIVGIMVYTWIAPQFAAEGVSTAPDWLLGGLLGAGGLVGIYLGARMQKYVPADWIKLVLAAVMLFLAVRYVAQFFL